MGATKRIPVTEKVWAEISELKKPGQTFDELLSAMAEHEKKIRLVADMKHIEERCDFVEMSFDA
jgi:predicted CopG family antitoxin